MLRAVCDVTNSRISWLHSSYSSACDPLQRRQFSRRDMAAHRMAVVPLEQARFMLFADAPDLVRAPGLEHAAGGHIQCARDFALQPDALALRAVGGRIGGEQRLGVGMLRPGEYRWGRADLHQPAQVK